MKSAVRWCKKCDVNIPHSKISLDSRDPTGWERAFIGLASAGFSELIRDPGYECQRCGTKTER